jgi:hypothetical protein
LWIRKPVHFAAVLSDDGDGWLAGRTEEVPTAGSRRGEPMTASLQGRRAERSVTFLKTYDAIGGGFDAVRYEGQINADFTEIKGRWIIPGNWSGKFVMTRPAAATLALSEKVEETRKIEESV